MRSSAPELPSVLISTMLSPRTTTLRICPGAEKGRVADEREILQGGEGAVAIHPREVQPLPTAGGEIRDDVAPPGITVIVLAEDEDIDAEAAGHGIGTPPADQRIRPLTAVEQIIAGGAPQRIRAGSAAEPQRPDTSKDARRDHLHAADIVDLDIGDAIAVAVDLDARAAILKPQLPGDTAEGRGTDEDEACQFGQGEPIVDVEIAQRDDARRRQAAQQHEIRAGAGGYARRAGAILAQRHDRIIALVAGDGAEGQRQQVIAGAAEGVEAGDGVVAILAPERLLTAIADEQIIAAAAEESLPVLEEPALSDQRIGPGPALQQPLTRGRCQHQRLRKRQHEAARPSAIKRRGQARQGEKSLHHAIAVEIEGDDRAGRADHLFRLRPTACRERVGMGPEQAAEGAQVQPVAGAETRYDIDKPVIRSAREIFRRRHRGCPRRPRRSAHHRRLRRAACPARQHPAAYRPRHPPRGPAAWRPRRT